LHLNKPVTKGKNTPPTGQYTGYPERLKGINASGHDIACVAFNQDVQLLDQPIALLALDSGNEIGTFNFQRFSHFQSPFLFKCIIVDKNHHITTLPKNCAHPSWPILERDLALAV
jgi:hypothetical protein